MDKTILLGLHGHDERFKLDEEAYDHLARYLDRAAAGLQDDPDHEEVIGDLERSIGDKLVARLGSEDRVVSAGDIDAVLEAVGAVETGDDGPPEPRPAPPRQRRLRRIREGQQLAGVCNGLADYAELRVDWVRTFFVLGTLVTAGLFGLVYVALAFILPVDATRDTR